MIKSLQNLLLLLLILAFSFTLSRNIQRIRAINRLIEEREEKIMKLKRENEEFEAKLKEQSSQEFIEKQLRDKLGLAKEGEIVVILPPEDVVRSFAPKFEKDVETLPDSNWKKWAHLFGF